MWWIGLSSRLYINYSNTGMPDSTLPFYLHAENYLGSQTKCE